MSLNDRLDVHDIETDAMASILLRRVRGGIGLTLSAEKNGDVEIFVSADDLLKIAAMLQKYSATKA